MEQKEEKFSLLSRRASARLSHCWECWKADIPHPQEIPAHLSCSVPRAIPSAIKNFRGKLN